MKRLHATVLLLMTLLLSTQTVAGVLLVLDGKPTEAAMAVEMSAQEHADASCHDASSASDSAPQHEHCQEQCGCCYGGCSSASALLNADLFPVGQGGSMLLLSASQPFPTTERERLLRPPIHHLLF
ncbi:hypothetical protein GP5015_1516 [gamma proteobacterium HTCC5015]|nr:hypothetical protein GP5015_1516 [gamma proteobacterium HTCC5015]